MNHLIQLLFKNTGSHRRNAKLYVDSKLKVNINPIYYWSVNSKYRVSRGRYWGKNKAKNDASLKFIWYFVGGKNKI